MYKSICFGKIRFPRGIADEDGKRLGKGASRPPLRDPCPINLLNRNPVYWVGAQHNAAESKRRTSITLV